MTCTFFRSVNVSAFWNSINHIFYFLINILFFSTFVWFVQFFYLHRMIVIFCWGQILKDRGSIFWNNGKLLFHEAVQPNQPNRQLEPILTHQTSYYRSCIPETKTHLKLLYPLQSQSLRSPSSSYILQPQYRRLLSNPLCSDGSPHFLSFHLVRVNPLHPHFVGLRKVNWHSYWLLNSAPFKV